METFADLLAHDHVMLGHCTRCGRSEKVDLEAIVASGRGDDVYIGRRLRCSACGHRDRPIIMAGSAYRGRSQADGQLAPRH